MGKIICHCYKVSKKDIKNAIASGTSTFKELKKETKISKGCGKCKKKGKKYFKKQLKKWNKEQPIPDLNKEESVM